MQWPPLQIRLVNATVLDDAVRFVASHAAPKTTEKANSDDRVTIDEDVSNRNDIQGSQENSSYKKQSADKNKQLYFLTKYQTSHLDMEH